MTLTIKRQTSEVYGSYLVCSGCGLTADHGNVIEADSHLPDVHSADPRWMRLCDRCFEALGAWITQGEHAGVVIQ